MLTVLNKKYNYFSDSSQICCYYIYYNYVITVMPTKLHIYSCALNYHSSAIAKCIMSTWLNYKENTFSVVSGTEIQNVPVVGYTETYWS